MLYRTTKTTTNINPTTITAPSPPQTTKLPASRTTIDTILTTIEMPHRSSWRLPNFWSKSITARSRRRRRRRPIDPYPAISQPNSNSSTNGCNDNNITLETHNNPASLMHNKYNSSNNNNNNNNNNNMDTNCTRGTASPATVSFCSLVTQTLSKQTWATYVALLVLSTTCSLCAASPCETDSWWDPVKDKCIPCTICQGELIPLRPCQLHRDTICGSIYDLKIDWVVLAKTEPNWKERRKSEVSDYSLEQHLTQEQLQQLHEETMPMDWQTAALFMAVLACLLFFIVAACILIHHMRQWRRMERRLDQDVEELSTKLMAKLAEVQSLEGGTFFIGNADALRVPTTFQPQHVLLPEKPAKHPERRILKTLQPGNVYIEENSSKG